MFQNSSIFLVEWQTVNYCKKTAFDERSVKFSIMNFDTKIYTVSIYIYFFSRTGAILAVPLLPPCGSVVDAIENDEAVGIEIFLISAC